MTSLATSADTGILTQQIAAVYIYLANSISPKLVNFGSATPAAEFQNLPWIKTNSDGSIDAVYTFFVVDGVGSWQTKPLSEFDTTGLKNQVLGNPTAGSPAWTTPPQIYTGLPNPNIDGANDGTVVTVSAGATGTFAYSTPVAVVTAGATPAVILTNATAVSNKFTSPAGPLADGSVVTAAHGLATIPSWVRCVLVCTTADCGFSPGDEVDMSSATGTDSTNPVCSYGANSSEVFATIRKASIMQLAGNSTGTATGMTAANWSVKMYAGLV